MSLLEVRMIIPDINWEKQWKSEQENDYWKIPDSDVVTLSNELNTKDSKKVLDFGCGLGRHSILFTQKGYEVTAIDISKTAIYYLYNWANDEGLKIKVLIADIFSKELKNNYFDIVICFNVIYHNIRKNIVDVLNEIWKKLKKSGIVYLTFLTRDDDKYGIGEEVEKHAFLCETSIHPGDLHYFADESDLIDLLQNYNIIEMKKAEHTWLYKRKNRFSSFWKVRCSPLK